MRSKFQSYYRPSQQQFQALWSTCRFFPDANVLLGLYRYSKRTRAEILDILRKLRDRLSLTHQTGFEYHQNRLSTVSGQNKLYAEAQTKLGQLVDEFESDSRAPFLSDHLLRRFRSVVEAARKELASAAEDQLKLIEDDPIRADLTEIFEGRVGEPFSADEVKKVEAEGARRYEGRVPPGYKDDKKPSGKYGDFIFWKQVLDACRETSSPAIVVTNDRKEDWWLQHEGQTIGPRPELITEFSAFVQKPFYMYSVESFVKRASRFLKKPVEEKVLKEIREDSEAAKAVSALYHFSEWALQEQLQHALRGLASDSLAERAAGPISSPYQPRLRDLFPTPDSLKDALTTQATRDILQRWALVAARPPAESEKRTDETSPTDPSQLDKPKDNDEK